MYLFNALTQKWVWPKPKGLFFFNSVHPGFHEGFLYLLILLILFINCLINFYLLLD